LAGVGADPRGQRHFNLEKQAQLFDPAGDYVKQWQGQKTLSCLDSLDAADWPLYLPE
jgi:deoxyribodipyrimidine photo-lyase